MVIGDRVHQGIDYHVNNLLNSKARAPKGTNKNQGSLLGLRWT